MEEISEKIYKFCQEIKIIFHVLYGVVIGLSLYLMVSGKDIGLLFALCSSGAWYITIQMVNLKEIIVTRFVAMTENIFEITEMLEKKLKEENS